MNMMMFRSSSTGQHFSIQTIDLVWQKAKIVPGYDPNDYRKDSCGAWIKKSPYGTTGQYGGKLIISNQFPRTVRMNFIIFSLFTGKTTATSQIIIQIGVVQWEQNRFKVYTHGS
jgi:hypothetical protein